MKIAIIGGGWIGCHLAHTLKHNHNISLFSKSKTLIDSTSLYNQNRLHRGFHYARNHNTRVLCANTFNKFIKTYPFLVKEVNNNLYSVPLYKSNIDYKTYKKIFNDFSFYEVESDWLVDTDGTIRVDERYIDPLLTRNFFNSELSQYVIEEEITINSLQEISSTYDIVINCTNNHLMFNAATSRWERCVMLIYEQIEEIEFGALTMVDGDLFSIYPYIDNTFTVSHVLYTPALKSNTHIFNDNGIDIEKIKMQIEYSIQEHYKEFTKHFKYKDYVVATKSKTLDKSDGRSPVISCNKNVINCFTGKIQGLFQIEDFIHEKILNWE